MYRIWAVNESVQHLKAIDRAIIRLREGATWNLGKEPTLTIQQKWNGSEEHFHGISLHLGTFVFYFFWLKRRKGGAITWASIQ